MKILFRGKQNCGDWVYGYYHKTALHNQDAILTKDGITKLVIPETVGQWSGETDINNKKIFEGDVVKYTHDWEVQGEYDAITVVDFCCGGFEPMSLANGGAFYCCNNRKYEILGNIHDDPELLEE